MSSRRLQIGNMLDAKSQRVGKMQHEKTRLMLTRGSFSDNLAILSHRFCRLALALRPDVSATMNIHP